MSKSPNTLLQRDYGQLYGDLYGHFPQERRVVGSNGLSILQVSQEGHEKTHPAVASVVFRLNVEGALSHSRVNFGEGDIDLTGRPGSFYLAPARAVAQWESEGDHRIMLMAIPEARVQTMLGAEDEPDPLGSLYGRELHSPTVSALMSQIWTHSAQQGRSDRLISDGLVLSLLGTLVGHAEAGAMDDDGRGDRPLDATRLQRVTDYVEENLAVPLTVDMLADIACLSSFHFARRFREATGETPHAYVIGRRIDAGRRMLEADELSIGEIAHACGFSSQSHFTTQFRSRLGMPPGAWRNRARKGG